MELEDIAGKLRGDIDTLRDPRGFIRASSESYNRLFGRDSLIVSWQLLDAEPSVCRSTLEILSTLQGKRVNEKNGEEPGKILHETDFEHTSHPEYPEFPFPYYGSVDSTPLFLILFSLYFEKTGDKEFIKSHWQNISAAVDWIVHYGDKDKDGFLEYERKNPHGLFHQGWKDGFEDHLQINPPVAIVEVQGYAYLALSKTAFLAESFGKTSEIKEFNEASEKLKKSFNAKFWMEKEKYFCFALDKDKKQKKSLTSNPGHLLFTEIVDNEKVKFVVEKLFQPSLWTPFGIRTHASTESDFDPLSYHMGSIWPHDNWIIAQGLKELGYKKEYDKIKTAMIKVFERFGFIPELYGVIDDKLVQIPRAQHTQAWASGALLNFITA